MSVRGVVWVGDSSHVDVLRQRDFWFRYHAVDENLRLDVEHRFVFPWDEHFDFNLDAGPEELTLSLVERGSGHSHVLGWWDDARWHPFALRWSELLMLVRTWGKRSDVLGQPFPLLLLSRFVGFGIDESDKHEEAARLVADAYRGLGFTDDDVSNLTARALPVAEENDYRWTHDAELGWVFSGEYACYSLRNREHCDGQEGRFPFAYVLDLFSKANA